MKSEIFLIPESFRGKVNIIYNVKEGTEEKYENNMRVYSIPKNGILLTKFKDIYGDLDQHFYFIDSIGNRKLIKLINEEKNIKDDTTIYIFRAGTIGVYGDTNDSTSLIFQEFYVSNKRSLDDYFKFEYVNKFDSIIMKLTNSKF